MTNTLIGYARCSTDKQDPTTQKDALLKLGVVANRIYTHHGLTSTKRARPSLDQALETVRSGDTLVVPKLDQLARSVPDARLIGDDHAARGEPDPYAHTRGNGGHPLQGETAWQEAKAFRSSAQGATPYV